MSFYQHRNASRWSCQYVVFPTCFRERFQISDQRHVLGSMSQDPRSWSPDFDSFSANILEVAGVCVGIASSICPVYQAEIAPKEIRGRVVSLQQWAITWGILIQYFIQYGASWVGGGPNNPNQPTSAFRIPWGVQIVPAVILFFGMFFLPRSPRWLASKDRWEEAIQIMANLHGGGDVNHPKVLAEYQEIEEALRFEREEAISSYRQLVEPRMLKRVLLGMSIQMWSQLCGMNIMMYYIVCKYPHCCKLLYSVVLISNRHHGRSQHRLATHHSFHSVHS